MAPEQPLFGEDYFRRCYRDYERQNPRRKMRFYRMLAEKAVGGLGRPRVVDVGCAFGSFLSALDARWRLYGMDVSEYAVERARHAVPHARFEVSGLPRMPFVGRFDLITAFDVIEHVPSLDQVLPAVRGKLEPNAHFLFVVPVYDGPTGPVVRLLDRDATHLHRNSRRFWLEWAASRFDLVEWWGIYRYLLPWNYYIHKPTRRFRAMTPAIAVLVRNRAGEHA